VVFASRCRPRRGSRCRRSVMTRIIVLQCVVQHRCGRVQATSSRAHDAGLSSCARNTTSAKRSVGTRRAASMQDTLSEGTARAAQQLAPSASPPASAVGRSATRSVVADSVRQRALLYAARSRVLNDVSVVFRLMNALQVLPETGCINRVFIRLVARCCVS